MNTLTPLDAAIQEVRKSEVPHINQFIFVYWIFKSTYFEFTKNNFQLSK